MEKNTIFVRNFETNCLIGIYPKEKKEKQRIKISVTLQYKRKKKSDRLSSTLSYEKIINYLKNIEKFKHINLVETLANNICEHFADIKNVCFIEVEIIKCDLLKNKTEIGFLLQKFIND